MTTMRTRLLYGITVLAGTYVIACLSIAVSVGRHSPRLASLLSPPFFNFDHTYNTGIVFGFQIGSSKEQIGKSIAGDKAVAVDPSCWSDHRAGGSSLYSREKLQAHIMREATTCIAFPSGENVYLRFDDGTLVSVTVRFLRNEVI